MSDLARKAAVHARIMERIGAISDPGERREFVRRMARATGRSVESAYRWCGLRQEKCAPPSTALEAVERFLAEEAAR